MKSVQEIGVRGMLLILCISSMQEHKIIKDYDLAIVRQKVDKLIEKWKEMDNKEKNTEFAHNKTLEIKRLNYKIKNILLDGLVQNIDVFQHYKNNAEEELAELDVSIKAQNLRSVN